MADLEAQRTDPRRRTCRTRILLVVAREPITIAGLALAAYERALEPQRLVLIPGNLAPYIDPFALADATATGWSRAQLGSKAVTSTSLPMRMENPDDHKANHWRQPSLERVRK